jgi:hypothetical protein
VTRHARNLKQLVVQGIAGNRAFGGQGLADEARRVRRILARKRD